MSGLDEKLLIDLINRIAQELPFYKVAKRGQQQTLLKHNEQALIDLCGSNQIDIVVQGLLEQIDKLIKMPTPSSEENAIRLAKSELHLLSLLQRCLAFPWDHIKAQYENLNGQDLDKDVRMRLKEKAESVLPPPINEEICKRLYSTLVHFLTSKTLPTMLNLNAEIQSSAAKCLFQFSASNYENIAPHIVQFIAQQNVPEEDILAHIYLLEHLNHNAKQLSDLLARIGKIIGNVKKSAIQVTMAKVIRKVIWNWIDRYPIEFVNLCKSEGKLPGNPDQLFDVFDGWAKDTKAKVSFWPVCTMLLILCPDVMLKVVLNKETGAKNTANKQKFLDSLKKGLGSSKLGDISAVCYVDICKASTYVSKSDTSALRYIVPDIEAELKEKLFNTQNVKALEVHEQLMIDCLLSFFYLSPRKVMNSLFADCVKPSSPPLFKRVLVKGLLQIASESTLPWNPSINDVYSIHASHLRQMFQDFLISVREYDSIKNTTDKKVKIQLEKAMIDIGILPKLISLYKVDPVLALFPLKTQGTQEVEDIRSLLTGLCDCVAQFDLIELSKVAREALLALHEPENIKKWCPKQGIEGFWQISSSVNICLAQIIVDRIDLEPKVIYNMISLLETILSSRHQFLAQADNIKPDQASKPLRLLASTKLESAFLIHLGSSNIEIVSKCANCFRYLCAEVELLRHYIDENDNSIVANYDSYKQLASSGVLSTGRQAQQKAIRTILKTVNRQTVGNFTAWDEVCYRWQIITTAVKANEEASTTAQQGQKVDARKKKAQPVDVVQHKLLFSKNTGDIFLEWTNFLGILCSLAAVTGHEGASSRSIGARQSKAVNCSTPDEFLQELMNLLVKDLVNIRETVKMMLGNATSPHIYPNLFRTLHRESKSKLFGESDQVLFNNESNLFVDQSISIIKLILDNEQDSEELSLVSDFEDIIFILLKFVRQLTISLNSVQIRHKLASLIEVVMARIKVLSLRNEYQFRTDLIENIMEWTSEFSTKESNIPGFSDLQPQQSRQMQKLIKELDAQVMQAIAALLKALPLQGKDDDAKSNLFSKFFNFFTNFLTRCKKSPKTVLTPQLPEATIQSLSYLVTANIEHGLEYFVTMGYHRDYETRSAFLKVLTNILKERTDFDSGDGGDKYYKLLELVMDPGAEVILTLCDVTAITEADYVAQLLVRIFEANEKTLDLLKAAIQDEVKKTESANTLFRRNSMATKLLAAYCKLIGRDYLRAALGPQLKVLLQNPPPSELNPSLLPEGQDLQENQKTVLHISEQFLVDIQNSIPQCPAPFRELCRFLKECVSEKFPGSEHTAIAGFMFLRYLCPAIVAPDGFEVVDQPIEEIRRCLVLVTKVLQNLANRVQFTKEPFMHCMNPFIEGNVGRIRDLFDIYANVSEEDPQVLPIAFPDEQKEEDLGRLHFYLSRSLDKMTKAWTHASSSNLDRLTSILAQLGPAPELPTATKNIQVKQNIMNSADKSNLHFEKFMQRMAGKNTSPIVNMEVYYQSGKSKKGIPIFYYIAKNYKASGSGMEDLLIYHMLQITQPFLAKKYSVVIDLTMFAPDNYLPPGTLNTLSKVIPTISSENLENVYFINPNQWFKKYSKTVAKYVGRVMKKFVFCSKVSQIFDFIAEDQVKLPVDTLSIERTVQSTFSPVTKVTQYNRGKEVKVLVCTEVLEIITQKQVPIFGHATVLFDIIHVSHIGDIVPFKDNFVIKYDSDGPRSITLVSNSSEQIIQQLTATKDRYKISQPQNSLARSKAFRPSDVPGTLLNMALMNLTVSNHELRVAAYNLLVSLCNSFAFKINSNLLEATDIAIPKNSRHFTVRVSRELAQTEPAMTLEFLQQSLDGFSNADKVSQVLVLDYISPWLHNLGTHSLGESNSNAEKTESKMKEIITSLISLTLRETEEIGPAILTHVWQTLGKCPKILDNILESLLIHSTSKDGSSQLPAGKDSKDTSLLSSIGTKTMDCFEDIVLTIAAQLPSLVTGKLLQLFFQLIQSTTESPEQASSSRIEKHTTWVKIEILIRWFLILSFDNLLCVHQYLPELFHLIILTFFSGDALIRSSIYALFINIIHSLITSNEKICPEDKLQKLKLLFNQYHEVQYQLHFGIGGKSSYSPFLKLADRDAKIENFPITQVENVANSLYQVLNCLTTNVSCIGIPQHTSWLQLTTKTAFTKNPFLQPRAICCIGTISQSPDLVSDDLVGKLLVLLRDALIDCSSGKNQIDDLPTSIISCLSRLFTYLRPTSKFYHSFFWIAMSLCQIHDQVLFAASAQLLDNVVRSMFDHGCFKGVGLSAFVMKYRTGKIQRNLDNLDQLTGLSFKNNFSFAVAGHLLKGLRTAGTKQGQNPTRSVNSKAIVTRLLNTFVEYSRESNPANLVGYLAALLPHCGDNISNNIRQLLLQSSESGQSLFNTAMVPDKLHAALLFTVFVTILKSSESEHEQLYVYKALEEGVHFMPDSFPVTFEVLNHKMQTVIASSQNNEILSTVLSIMESIYTYGLESSSCTVTLTKSYLDTSGFSSLPESDQFHTNNSTLIPVICTILDGTL